VTLRLNVGKHFSEDLSGRCFGAIEFSGIAAAQSAFFAGRQSQVLSRILTGKPPSCQNTKFAPTPLLL
jgi:hypothetical protein